ncbi:MAG: trypsin-like serine protease [bacterium]
MLAIAGMAGQAIAQSPLNTGTKVASLLRTDQPNRPPANATTGDPSLIVDFNSVVNGINANGVGYLTTPVPGFPGFAFFCTASRIGLRTLITAAHCVTDGTNGSLLSTTGSTAITVFGPGSTNAAPNRVSLQSSSVVVRSEWRGFDVEATAADGRLGYDVALVNYDFDLPSWMTTYGLYTQDPFFQNSTHIGDGTYGNGTQGGVGFDALRRWGENRVDYFDPSFTTSDWNILYTDFDDGTQRHDAFCYIGAFFCDGGRGNTEAGTAPGDSGGPIFVGTEIAGVTSFGTYFCLNASCTQTSLANNNVTNGYGSVQGFAGVWGNEQFIEDQVAAATATPEPASIVLMLTGLAAIGGVARRRRAR